MSKLPLRLSRWHIGRTWGFGLHWGDHNPFLAFARTPMNTAIQVGRWHRLFGVEP